MRPFELSKIGGPWGHRLAQRRGWIDALPWDEDLRERAAIPARLVWTQTAFSEYASAAAFAEIAAALLRTGAPIDLIAAAGDFVVDEVLHAEVAARIALALVARSGWRSISRDSCDLRSVRTRCCVRRS